MVQTIHGIYGITIGKEEKMLLFFSDDMITFLENSRELSLILTRKKMSSIKLLEMR